MMKFKTKDSGKRTSFSTGMQRDTQEGKPRYDLVIAKSHKYDMLTRWAELMARGAEKYCKPTHMTYQLLFNDICDIIGIWNPESNVNIKIDLYTAMNYAGLVTKNSYERIILSSEKDNFQTEGLGEEEIRKKSGWLKKNDKQTRVVLKETEGQNISTGLKLEVLPKNLRRGFCKSKEISAEFVDENLAMSPFILTMTVKRGMQEASFALGATTVLECLEMIYTDLSKHFYTSEKIHPRGFLLGPKNLLMSKNDRNWELASTYEELSRFKASAFRHFMQWFKGDTDEDHAAAVYFNINAFEYVKEKKGE